MSTSRRIRQVASIDAPHFNAGVIIGLSHRVTLAAPIVKYMMGWTPQQVRDYCARKRWSVIFQQPNGGN